MKVKWLEDMVTLFTMPPEMPVLKEIVMLDGSAGSVIKGSEQDSTVNVLPLNVPSTLARTGCVINIMKTAITQAKILYTEFFKKDFP